MNLIKLVVVFITSLFLNLSCEWNGKELTRKEQLTRYQKEGNFSLKIRKSPVDLDDTETSIKSPILERIWNFNDGTIVDFTIIACGTKEFMVVDYSIKNGALHLTLENVSDQTCMCEYELHYRFEIKEQTEDFETVFFTFRNYR